MSSPIIPPTPPQPPTASTARAAPSAANAKPPEGRTEIDTNLSLEVQIAAHDSVSRICRDIRARLSVYLEQENTGPFSVILMDRSPADLLEAYETAEAQIRSLAGTFRSAAEVASRGLSALQAAPAVTNHLEALQEERPAGMESISVPAISAAVDLLGLLRQDVSYSGRSVTINPLAFAFELSHQWEPFHQVRFCSPTFIPPATLTAGKEFAQEWSSRFDSVMGARERAFRQIHSLATAVGLLRADDPLLPPAHFALNHSRDQFESADAILRQLGNRLNAVDKETGCSTFQTIRYGWLIHQLQTHPNTLFLYAKVTHAGGSYRVSRHLFRLLFLGDGLSYSGGAVATYALCRPDGSFLAAGTIACRVPHSTVQDFLRNVTRRVSAWFSRLPTVSGRSSRGANARSSSDANE